MGDRATYANSFEEPLYVALCCQDCQATVDTPKSCMLLVNNKAILAKVLGA